MAVPIAVATRIRVIWRMRLHSAFRTTLACAIVGCATLYCPASLTSLVKFPSFAYLTAMLIVSDARLGDTIRGCWHAFCATALVLPLSIFSLWLIKTADKYSPGIAALAVALHAFLIALPKSTHLMSKRIAFGQIVILYVDAVNYGVKTSAVMHPLHVASSTALGAIASVLALLLPYPHLAFKEVRVLRRLYVDNAAERINLYLRAFCEGNQNNRITAEARIFAETGNKLLQNINVLQEGVEWETFIIRLFRPNFVNPGERLRYMEAPIKGMEMALTSTLFSQSHADGFVDLHHDNILNQVTTHLQLKLEQARCSPHLNSVAAPELKEEYLIETLLPQTNTLPNPKDLPVIFFLRCAELFLNDSTMKNIDSNVDAHMPQTEASTTVEEHAELRIKRLGSYFTSKLSDTRLVFASKCSLSLSLAVFLGMIFDRENGYWSGLAIAISFETSKQAIFTMANARGQGTAIGSVYGVLSCFVFQRFDRLVFLALPPWIILTSLLRHSRMYGTTGGFSAAIGALLILGRKDYGPPREFAISRLVEVFIGLACYITVELLVRPTRAATLAKNNVLLSLEELQECIQCLILHPGQREQSELMKERQKLLKVQIDNLNQYILDAELEPDFWFLPFPGHCYRKLQRSFSNMADLMHLMVCNVEHLSLELHKYEVAWGEIQEQMSNSLEHFKSTFNTSIKLLESTSQRSSAVSLNVQEKTTHIDLEKGDLPNTCVFSLVSTDDEAEKILYAFFQLSREIIDKTSGREGEKESKEKMILSLSRLGFCIYSLTREVKYIERYVRQLVI